MKIACIRRIALVSVSIAAIFSAGCASVITDDGVEKNTAASLGLEKGSFVISDRNNDGVKTTYLVKTNDGRKYNCYMTGGISMFGRVSSDAVCTEIQPPPKPVASPAAAPAATATPAATPAATTKKAAPCNALQKAAGKCK